jgi:hypothetical protein
VEEVLIVLKDDSPGAAHDARRRIESRGSNVRQQYGPAVMIVEAAPDVLETLKSDRDVAGVFAGAVPEELARQVDETGKLGIAAWNQRHSASYQEAKRDRKGEGLAWDHPGFEPEGRQEP